MAPIRVGIQIQQQHGTYRQIRDAWKAVDASGADTLFNWDHFFPLQGDPPRQLDRFILGIGSGWNQRDYEEYGYAFGTAASRLRDLDRDMAIIMDRLAKLNPGSVRAGWRRSEGD